MIPERGYLVKRVIRYGLLLIVLTVWLVGCGQAPTPEPTATARLEPTEVPPTAAPLAPAPARELSVYEDSAYFTLEYPADWEIVERPSQNSVIFLTPQAGGEGVFRENVGILRQELDDPSTTVGTYTREFLAAAPQMVDGYALVTSEPARLSGLPAHRVIYGGSQNGVALGWLQVWTISDGNAYVLTYTGDPDGFETFLDDANGIVESFTLK